MAEKKATKKDNAPKITKPLPRKALRLPKTEVVEIMIDFVPLLK